MKQISTQSVIQQADRYHDLQRKHRDLMTQAREIEAEMLKISPALLKVAQGQDFTFPSADGYMKVCEINEVAGPEDIPKMREMLLKLRRKIPMTTKTSTVVRYLTDDEVQESD